jgi:hypothetical protein
MKTRYLITSFLLAALSAGLISGCSKQLKEDPRASLTPGTYFQTQNDLDAAVAGMYAVLAHDGAWGFTNKMTTYFGADDLTTDPGLNKGNQREFDQLAGASDNPDIGAMWNGPWQTIYNANNILANYEQVNSTDAQKNESAGQAYFLRGLCYYYLVRTFGQLPLVLTTEAGTHPPRSSVDSIYALIISDLQQAKTMLGTTKSQGLPTTYSASAVLADVYLTMAGWPLNDASKYDMAASEAKTVMQSGVYDLSTPYDKVFTTNNCAESIFALQYSVAGNLPNRSFGSTSVPLDEVATDGSSGWDDFYPEINFFKKAPACTRTDLTFYTTLKLIQPDKSFVLTPWNSPTTHAQHPYYKKFRAGLNGDGVNETATAINTIQPSTNKETIIVRYPQVLLDFAEASAMAGSGPTTESYDAINEVRTRAGEPPLVTGLSASDFRDSVVNERAYEFAGEFGMRWFDIVRLQMLDQITTGRDPAENPLTHPVDQTRYLAPIPYSEMVLNPDWKQNDGY